MKDLPHKRKRHSGVFFSRRELLWAAAVVVLAGVVGVFVWNGAGDQSDQLMVVLWSDGQAVWKENLADLQKENISLEIYGVEGYLEAEPGRIRFVQMNCPDKICESAGWLSAENQTAVCMPNRISMTVLTSQEAFEI